MKDVSDFNRHSTREHRERADKHLKGRTKSSAVRGWTLHPHGDTTVHLLDGQQAVTRGAETGTRERGRGTVAQALGRQWAVSEGVKRMPALQVSI